MTPNEHGPESWELDQLRQLAESNGTSGRAQMARVSALRVLERYRREEQARAPEPEFAWEGVEDERIARRWLELRVRDAICEVCRWDVSGREWHAGSWRTRECDRVAAEILGAPNPVMAFREWLAGARGDRM
jgi:hypothetical protein